MEQLKTIAVVQMGLSFRSRIEHERDGNIAVIQMRDLGESHKLGYPRHLMTINRKAVNERHFVQRNDLVFRSRGKTTTAIMIDTDIAQAVVAAPLLRIRVTNAKVLPEYLCWVINQPSSQAFLHSRATGTAMMMIGKATLAALEIPLPDLAQQQNIAALAELSAKEQTLMADLARQRQRFITKVLIRWATEPQASISPN